jgi:fumarate reductase subunit C
LLSYFTKLLFSPAGWDDGMLFFYFREQMKKDKSVIAAIMVTIYLLIYLVMLSFEDTVGYGMLMFSFSPLVLIAMVFYILKYGKQSKRTFDDNFYEDADY